MSTLKCTNVTSPPVLKLQDSQGYLWLSYDLAEVINLIGETFEQKKLIFFKKILYVIPSALVSFLPYYCHSFRIIVIPSIILSFYPNQCHSFQIITISNICHPEQLQYPPIPEGREKWPPEVAIYASKSKRNKRNLKEMKEV